MKLSINCLPCLLNQAIRLAKVHLESEEEQCRLIKKILQELVEINGNTSAPYLAQKIQQALKDALQNSDPYKEQKHFYNQEMLKLECDFTVLIESSSDHLQTALKFAAAGNIIDFGPGYDLSRDKVLQTVHETLKKALQQDVFLSLKSDLNKARQLLYLGDNAGEIVFDKIFIRTIKEQYPSLEIYFATRGKPVINDAVEEDAYYVGMDAYASIINNGTDIPGTIIEQCSSNFVSVFNKADLIISKGLGNFESLYGTEHRNLYYLFLCKCNIFKERFDAELNDIMLIRE
ncbi:MAG: ARMT1-like domain-containing protein [Syntrophomonadaceae bacterium]|nr:ARMT1-like domain-containing protein [Syntrophomonadaceae bacterium]MDD3023377.1 ARMT1-like domain-containing protein [Syntrophomonadaceae bacterium]